MDRFIVRNILIVRIGEFCRAVLDAGRTTGALVLYNVSGLLDQGNLKISCFPFYIVNFSKC